MHTSLSTANALHSSDLFVLLQLQMQISNERKKNLALTRLHSDTELAQFEWMTSKRVKKSHCLQT